MQYYLKTKARSILCVTTLLICLLRSHTTLVCKTCLVLISEGQIVVCGMYSPVCQHIFLSHMLTSSFKVWISHSVSPLDKGMWMWTLRIYFTGTAWVIPFVGKFSCSVNIQILHLPQTIPLLPSPPPPPKKKTKTRTNNKTFLLLSPSPSPPPPSFLTYTQNISIPDIHNYYIMYTYIGT